MSSSYLPDKVDFEPVLEFHGSGGFNESGKGIFMDSFLRCLILRIEEISMVHSYYQKSKFLILLFQAVCQIFYKITILRDSWIKIPCLKVNFS